MNDNHARARQFIMEFFGDEELNDFCFDYFPLVYNQFTTGMPKGQKVRLLVDYCRRAARLPDLLAALERERPEAYESHFEARRPAAKPQAEAQVEAIERNPRQLFISHAHEDDAFARRLAQDLIGQGWAIWIAPDSIRPGEKWVEAISRGMAESGFFLLVLTEAAINSRWVRNETNVAIDMEAKDELEFLPLELEEVTAPLLWRGYQWISFRDDYKSGLEKLLGRLQPEEMERLSLLYDQLRGSVGSGDWPEAQRIGKEILEPYPNYRETAELLAVADREEKRREALDKELAQLYEQLQAAIAAEAWDEASGLVGQIRERDTDYRDVSMLAKKVERRRRQQDRQDLQAQLAWLRRLPSWSWAILILVPLALILLWLAFGRDDGTQEEIAALRATATAQFQAVEATLTAGASLEPSSTADRQPTETAFQVLEPTATTIPSRTPTATPEPTSDAEIWTRPVDGMVMVYVPPPDAPFVLRSGVDAPGEGYWIDKYEVSNAQYQLCVDDDVCEPSVFADDEDLSGADFPVVGISWFDAATYAAWVGGELPKEADWEYAAVGDTGKDFPWGNEASCELANTVGCVEGPAAVGSYPDGASWVGALDMAGNVWEWTASRWDLNSELRVLRGGSWNDRRGYSHSAYRANSPPDSRFNNLLGFRVVVRHVPEAVNVETTAMAMPAETTESQGPPPNAQLGDAWTRPVDGMEMVYVPPPEAPFVLESGVDAPLEGFWIDKYEVSNAQYQLCVDAGACEPSAFADDEDFNGADYPVVGVSWYDAADYSGWVGGELPTEAEWEYTSAGAGGRAYPWGDDFDGKRLNFCDANCPYDHKDDSWDDGFAHTAPVGSYLVGESWSGAADMAGNVWEWTASSWDEDSARRVVHGGAWGDPYGDSRAATRHFDVPSLRGPDVGFRVLIRRSPDAAEAALTATATIEPLDGSDEPPPNAQLGDEWTRPADGMVMVYVPPPKEHFVLESGVAAPQEGYWIDKYEVSNTQYQWCADAGACEPLAFADDEDLSGANHPVVAVSWFDAAAYSAWVGGELPTEAEWEYAAFGDSGTDYPWGDEFDGTKLNFCDANCSRDWKDESWDDSHALTAPVGSYPAGESWVGAADMAGNVWEWTASFWAEGSEERVLRGGAWNDSRDSVHGATRVNKEPDFRSIVTGYRVVRRSSSQ